MLMANDLTFSRGRLSDALFGRATIYHSDQWIKCLSGYFGYQPCSLVLQEDENVSAFAPLVRINNLTGRKITSPPASMYGHAIADSDNALYDLISRIDDLGRETKSKIFVKVMTEAQLPLNEVSREFDSVVTLCSKDDAWDNLQSSARQAVRKSCKMGVDISFAGEERIGDFFSLLVLTKRRLGLPVAPKQWFHSLMRAGIGELVLAYRDERLVAGVFFLKDHNAIHYALPAYSDEGATCRALDACLWGLTQFGFNNDFSQLCLGGSDVSNEGLRRFKRKWGGKERLIRVVGSGYKKEGRSTPRSSRIVSKLPSPALQAVGYLYLRYFQ